MGNCPAKDMVAVKEGFLSFSGTKEQLQSDPGFQQLVREHSCVVVRHDVIHCTPTEGGGQMKCKRGIVVTAFREK